MKGNEGAFFCYTMLWFVLPTLSVLPGFVSTKVGLILPFWMVRREECIIAYFAKYKSLADKIDLELQIANFAYNEWRHDDI